MKKSKLNSKEQGKLRNLSTIIYVLSIIGKICLYISIFGIVICMAIVPFFYNHINVEENKLSFTVKEESLVIKKIDSDTAKITTSDNSLNRNISISDYNKIRKVFDKYSIKQLKGYTEAILLVVIVYIYLLILVLKHLGKLFKNIRNGDTPFTLDNVDHMNKMGLYMIISILFPIAASLMFKLIAGFTLDNNFGAIDIIQILFVFAMSYVFKYGYNLQQDKEK